MCTPDEQKIIDLLSSNDLAKKILAFKFIKTLDIPFDWDKYVDLCTWLREGEDGIIGGWDSSQKSRWFSDQEEAVIRVFSQTNQGSQHTKLKIWDERIYLLPNLKVLDFHSNEFEQIPKAINQLKKLEHLNLNRNCLTVITKELDQNNLLEYLSLAYNNIHAIDTDFNQLENLNYLDLAGNKLTELPQSIGNLSHLSYLNLSNNPLERLPESISNLKRLEKLYLHKTQIAKDAVDNLRIEMPNCDVLHSQK
jgi:Leucine-rich repeat (LRR) protein